MKSSAKKVELASVDDLFSTEESRADAQREKVLEIPLSELHPFKDHPFKVKDDEAMMETADSIRQYGVLVPAIARPDPNGGYELVAGHRRHRASELAGKDTMPVIVRDLDDDQATIIMVDSNLQRESLLPSERAFAYKMKLEAVKHQGARTDLTSRQLVGKLEMADVVGEKAGDSGRQVQRYIRLTELIPELLDINYQLSQNEDKTAIFEGWCDFLNYFDSSIRFQLSFLNLAASQERIFNAQYQLTLTEEVEVRYRTETRTDSEGNEYDVEVPYNYYILNVTLTSKPISSVASELLTPEQLEMYQVYRQTLGNKPLIFGGGSADTSDSESLAGVEFVNGTRPGNQAVVDIAKSQVGNVGGQPYWSWYGFTSRVEWCACFVSWCYGQMGLSEPRFAACQSQGIPWFQSHGQWGGRDYANIAPGDAIFFDWDLDGSADHVGIVVGTDGSRVYTVEGNSGDACKIKSYSLTYECIKGYGLMNW